MTLSAATGPQAATLLQQQELPHASCYNAQQGVMVAAPQALPLHITSFTACEPDSERTEQFMQQFAADAHRALDHHLRLQQQQQQGGSSSPSSPRADLLLSLVRFNTTRAIVLNARAMGITAALMMAPESRSLLPSLPTTTAAEGAAADLSSAASVLPLLLPPSLRPTALQLSVSHHPWVDVLPLPELRDNLLRRDESTYDKKELCRDLRGFQAVEDGRYGGMVVWGEAWDPRGWEVTDAFAEKWPWVVEGCHALWESTAHWRAVRSASL
ncbi:hypothetical protein DBV05_g8071 [Lasiodiplodia theobromae]|uniref:Uncharacterized protein n=1 Tax=Lasiodiplodia theobromae TaxID=45133 RepID=A0A5N5D661_9PEZI|nr:hypothetical protein DBV05_g8071 [Lasiodiplodia theobromae]